MEKQNRAERRRSKFGGGRATEHGGWPTHEPNPVFNSETPDAATSQPKPDSAATIVGKPKAASKLAAADDEAKPAT